MEGEKHLMKARAHIVAAQILMLSAAVQLCGLTAFAEKNLAEIGADCHSLEYHLRLAPLKNTDARCSLIWNYTDSCNYCELSYLIPSLTSSDNLSGFESDYRLVEYSDGTARTLAEGTFRDSYTPHAALSAMLRVLPGSACVEIGAGKAAVSIPVPYEHKKSFAGYESSHALKELRNDISARRINLPVQSCFDSLDSLRSYIADSKDTYESFWQYLDRDTDITKAIPGGRYTLATVSDGRGSYDIIYIDGLERDCNLWQPFTVKGRLSPTIFADHFNLKWFDNNGNEADKEANATVEIQGTVLRLTFPLLKSSMRFSRIPK